MINKQIEMETSRDTEIETQAWPEFALTCIAVHPLFPLRLVLANEHNVGAHCVWLI